MQNERRCADISEKIALDDPRLVRFAERAVSCSLGRGETFEFTCPSCGGYVIGKKGLLSDDVRAICASCNLKVG